MILKKAESNNSNQHLASSWRLVIIYLTMFVPSLSIYSQTKAPILIVSSYNPDAVNMSSCITDFMDAYKMKEDDRAIVVENMNCRALSESPIWKKLMKGILDKYAKMDVKPAVMILLGQEAWVSYLSLPVSSLPDIPIMCGMVNKEFVYLPEGDFNPSEIEPVSDNIMLKAKKHHVVGGYLYEYNLEKNIELIKKYYPDTKHLALITDNSCGGLCMHACFKHEMAKHPEYQYIPLDGRKFTVYSMVNELNKLKRKTVLLLGSWRMDKNEGYFMHNSAYLMKDANPTLPVFSISTIGVGYWAIGGYSPAYFNPGKDLAYMTYDYIHLKDHGEVKLHIAPGKYTFDVKALASHGLSIKSIPEGSALVNQEITFWQKYSKFIWGITLAFLVLTSGILFLVYLLWKTNNLKRDLERSHEELVKSRDKAEESNRLTSAFLANMSHEIRTPLNAIVGFSNVLTSMEVSNEERTEFSSIIQQNSTLLLSLINDILNLSRLESGHTNFTFEETDIVELCQAVLKTAQMARPSDLEYIFDCPLKECKGLIDTQRLQQVLINLLTNAGKFTEKGSITLSFDVDESNKMYLFSVADTGCGIPIEKQTRIFNRFEKLNEFSQGTGLGLSICKITVERLGGKIWVDPQYKNGARFEFYLPIKMNNNI